MEEIVDKDELATKRTKQTEASTSNYKVTLTLGGRGGARGPGSWPGTMTFGHFRKHLIAGWRRM